jgi:hypothetical protein
MYVPNYFALRTRFFHNLNGDPLFLKYPSSTRSICVTVDGCSKPQLFADSDNSLITP